jgi:TolB-like protein
MGARVAALLLLLLAGCRAAPAAPAAPVPDAAPPPVGAAQAAPLYALLPPRNLTTDARIAADVSLLLQGVLEARGARFVPAAEVEATLQRHRLRYTDSISVAGARALARDTGATHVLLSTIMAAERGTQPRLGLSLRAVDASSGERLLSEVVVLDGRDFEGLLGLGAITRADELQEEAVARLAAAFGARGEPQAPPPAAPEPPADPTTLFVRPGFDLAAAGRIAVLPLVNRTRRPDAGLYFAELLGHWLQRAAGVAVVERTELMDAMVREGVRSLDRLDTPTLGRVGAAVGARYVALGSIDRVDAQVESRGRQLPEVEASTWIVDLSDGAVVAAISLRQRGDVGHRGLGLGLVRDVLSLADLTAGAMVAGLLEPRP